MAGAEACGQDGFVLGASGSEWYENLRRRGSCLKVLALLRVDRSLIHQLGPEAITALHKGVEHGCVALVKFILVELFDERGLCNCVQHDADDRRLTREDLLRKTNSYGSTAVNVAVVSGSPKMVLLLDWAIRMTKERAGELALQNLEDDYVFWGRTFATEERIWSEKERNRQSGVSSEVTVETEVTSLPVPDVNDDDIHIVEFSSSDGSDEDIHIVERSRRVHTEVISAIEGVFEDPGDLDEGRLEIFKELCKKNVDFEFVPLAHVFLHFLCSVQIGFSERDQNVRFRQAFLRRIVAAGLAALKREDGDGGATLKALFTLLDPRGRTILHAAWDGRVYFYGLKLELFSGVPSSILKELFNATDGAGRTILHLCCIRNDGILSEDSDSDIIRESWDWNRPLSLSVEGKLGALRKWCFPLHREREFLPAQLVVLFNSTMWSSTFWPDSGSFQNLSRVEFLDFSPLQLAAACGRINILEHILNHHVKFNSAYDRGLGQARHSKWYPPAVHLAAGCGQVEALQSILKFHVYDPIVQAASWGTALHYVLQTNNGKKYIQRLYEPTLQLVLPNSKLYDAKLKNCFLNLPCNDNAPPRMYSANEMSCINLLLQAGIDIWTPHVVTEELPNPGPMANDEARKWWYEKVVNEVVALKTGVSNAANATSVVAALVATASFIGPLQPPLGYGDISGYVQVNQSPVRVYLVCNSLSFYLSIASILMAVLPAIPMPKESLYEELLRGQRCLKGAVLMLLVSIICLLVSFSSSSLAVVSSEWEDRKLVVSCVVCGGVVCVVVLVIYVIRMLRMLFHRSDWFRRKFSQYMYF